MTKKNTLKEKILAITAIRYKPDRKPLKDKLKTWLRAQSYEDLLPMLEDLNKEQLGIVIYCGASRSAYRRTMERIKEYDDQIRQISRKTGQGAAPPPARKSAIDTNKGIEQLTPDEMKAVLHGSGEKNLVALDEWILAEITARRSETSVETA